LRLDICLERTLIIIERKATFLAIDQRKPEHHKQNPHLVSRRCLSCRQTQRHLSGHLAAHPAATNGTNGRGYAQGRSREDQHYRRIESSDL